MAHTSNSLPPGTHIRPAPRLDNGTWTNSFPPNLLGRPTHHRPHYPKMPPVALFPVPPHSHPLAQRPQLPLTPRLPMLPLAHYRSPHPVTAQENTWMCGCSSYENNPSAMHNWAPAARGEHLHCRNRRGLDTQGGSTANTHRLVDARSFRIPFPDTCRNRLRMDCIRPGSHRGSGCSGY
jgi:hypothetical protein